MLKIAEILIFCKNATEMSLKGHISVFHSFVSWLQVQWDRGCSGGQGISQVQRPIRRRNRRSPHGHCRERLEFSQILPRTVMEIFFVNLKLLLRSHFFLSDNIHTVEKCRFDQSNLDSTSNVAGEADLLIWHQGGQRRPGLPPKYIWNNKKKCIFSQRTVAQSLFAMLYSWRCPGTSTRNTAHALVSL